MSKPDAKRRYRARRRARWPYVPLGPIHEAVRDELIAEQRNFITSYFVGKTRREGDQLVTPVTLHFDPALVSPLYPCVDCGRPAATARGNLCDDCIPF